jgi:hypothetical protein
VVGGEEPGAVNVAIGVAVVVGGVITYPGGYTTSRYIQVGAGQKISYMANAHVYLFSQVSSVIYYHQICNTKHGIQ